MKLDSLNAWVTKCNDGHVWYNFGQGRIDVNIDETYKTNRLLGLLKYFHGNHTAEEKIEVFNQVCDAIGESDKKIPVDENGRRIIEDQTELAKTTIQSIMNFFSEFEFEPNFRFINTFCFECASAKSAIEYVRNYFALTDNSYLNSICEKMKSHEFAEIVNNMSKINATHTVNNRFKLYYGSAGTGKTTEAMKETSNNCMVCHSAMLPSDLMEDFKFVSGNAEFQPSSLQQAIVEGKQIVLDEINLLPFESLRFLQSILDGKKSFEYKGKTIEIKDGFKIIGTMNLTVNGCTYSLPEPLVDRCEKIKKFTLTANNLVSALI